MPGPNAAAKAPTAPHAPMTTMRLSLGKASSTNANAAGVSKQAPIDCNTLATISQKTEGDAPHANEAVINNSVPNMNIFFLPNLSAMPPAGINMAA